MVRTALPAAFVVLGAACGARTDLDSDPRSGDCFVPLASDETWIVQRLADGTTLGPAQLVCLRDDIPNPCPSGALVYGWSGSGWAADISGLAGAAWIWRPGISRTTDDGAPRYAFTKSFTLARAAAGTLSIAADDFGEVEVNGSSVGTIGSVTDESKALAAQSVLTQFDLTPALVVGENTIRIVAQNGAFGDCASNCDYQHNPAGVVFGGRIECQE